MITSEHTIRYSANRAEAEQVKMVCARAMTIYETLGKTQAERKQLFDAINDSINHRPTHFAFNEWQTANPNHCGFDGKPIAIEATYLSFGIRTNSDSTSKDVEIFVRVSAMSHAGGEEGSRMHNFDIPFTDVNKVVEKKRMR